MARKTKEQKRKHEKKLYDDFVNGYSLEELKQIDDGELRGDELLDLEDLERFGSLFTPKYPQLRKRYEPFVMGR
jgi:hypothetical protein